MVLNAFHKNSWLQIGIHAKVEFRRQRIFAARAS